MSRVDELIVTPGDRVRARAAPTNLTATPAQHVGRRCRGPASTSGSPTSYSIYRGSKSDGEAVVAVGTTNGTTTTFTDTGLHNGTTYFYNVAANNAVGVSPDSNEVTVVPAGAVTTPAAPTGLTATAGNATVALTWGASAGATSYSIFRGTTAGGESATAIGTSTSASFADTGRRTARRTTTGSRRRTRPARRGTRTRPARPAAVAAAAPLRRSRSAS